MKRISVFLADDHTLVREGLRSLLESERDLEVVGEAHNGRDAVKMIAALSPDVVLMDIGMPLLNGLEATRQVLAFDPGIKVIILSAHGDDEYVDEVALVGAAGYVLKHSSHADLAHAIREVHAGHRYYSPSIARRLQARFEPPGRGRELVRKRIGNLSAREMEVLQLVAEGLLNKQVAAELGISIKTVEKHRQHVMEKLDIHDIAGLTRYAVAAGIVEGGVKITIT